MSVSKSIKWNLILVILWICCIILITKTLKVIPEENTTLAFLDILFGTLTFIASTCIIFRKELFGEELDKSSPKSTGAKE